MSESPLSPSARAGQIEAQESPPPATGSQDGGGFDSSQWALIVFGAVIFIAVPLLLYLGRDMWFKGDEWEFLVVRDGGDLRDLLAPHNDAHWSTIPVLVYRLLYNVVGLNSYLPYQAIVVALHLTVAVLLRVIMRRSGVGPWISTIAAGVFVLFGSGYPNIIWAFQISLVGSMALGLAHLLLATHEGPLDRRDWLGLLAGFMALLCSGAGVTMVIVVGIATLVQRGVRAAVFHTAPLGAVYVLWWVWFARSSGVTEQSIGDPGQWLRFTANGVGGTFDSLGQVPGVGIALGVLLLVGLIVAWAPLDVHELRRRAACPGAMLIGAIVFLVIAALGRVAAEFDGGFVVGTEGGSAARYQHFVAAMLIPAIAVAADACIRRWRVAGPVVVVLLLVGIPGNVHTLADPDDPVFEKANSQARRNFVLSVPHLEIANDVPRTTEAATGLALRTMTVGWLLDGVESGRIPDPGPITPVQAATWSGRIALLVTDEPAAECDAQVEPGEVVRLGRDESLTIEGEEGSPVSFVYIAPDGTESRPISIVPLFDGDRLVALAAKVSLRVQPTADVISIVRCT